MRFETLDAWLDWQTGMHGKDIDLGLERVRHVYAALGGGRPAPVVITVAGTNGKGSTVAMLESILLAAGYRTGSYTSPHLHRYNERIRLNGQPVADAPICAAFDHIDQARGGITLTYFEFGTLAALDIFGGQALDVVILETGLGGRLDAVNIIDADVSIITSIDIDHSDWLGESREQIGLEKLGIGRAGRPLVMGDPQPPATVLDAASDKNMSLRRIGQAFGFQKDSQGWSWWRDSGERRHALPWPALRGNQQLHNAASVLEALALLHVQIPVGQNELRTGLESVHLPGRFEIRSEGARLILDVAHNPQAGRLLAENLHQLQRPGRTDALLAMLEDKDIQATLAPLVKLVDQWWLAALQVPRGASASRLRNSLLALGVSADRIHCYDAVGSALEAARATLVDEDILLIFGSFYTVSQADEALS